MYHYRIYGMRLLSDLPFRQLCVLSPEEEPQLPQITVAQAPFPEHLKQKHTCFSHIAKDISYLSNSHCYLLAEHGNRLLYERKADTKDALLCAYILGWGISMLCQQQNRLALHCSCIAGAKGAVLICGNSGAGKSTLTTALLNRGFSLMADDIAAVHFDETGAVFATSAFPYQKLCRDAALQLALPLHELIYIDENKDKFLVPYTGTFPVAPVPVHAIVYLTFTSGTDVIATELTGVNKFRACMNSLFLRPLLGEALYAPENGTRGLALASRVPMYHIARPIDTDSRDTVLQTILSYLS